MTDGINPSAALAALLGLGAGLGLLATAAGMRPRPGRIHGRTRLHRRGWADRRRLALAVVVGVIAGIGTGWVVAALIATGACWALPHVLGRDPGQARRVARMEAIATWTEMLRDTLSAAAGLEQAILASAPLAPVAIRQEITGLAGRIETGERLVPALRELADDLADPTADLVIASLVLAAEHQARQLGELLSSLATAAHEQASMRMRIEAGRARTRTSVRVIVGTTLTFAAAVVVLNRSYLAAYDGAVGQLVLAAIAALFGVGFTWLARISRTREPERFLALTVADPAAATGEVATP